MKNFTKTLAFIENEVGEIKGQFVEIHFTTPNGEISKVNTKLMNIIEGQIIFEDHNSPISLSDILVLKTVLEKILMVSKIGQKSALEPQTFTNFQLSSSLQHLYEKSGLKIDDGSKALEKLIQTPYQYLCPVDLNDEVFATGNGTVELQKDNPWKKYRIGDKAIRLFDMVDSVNFDLVISDNWPSLD